MQKGRVFVGIDLHKVLPQVAVVDEDGALLFNGRVENNRGSIHEVFSMFPAGTRCVIESSSVWLGVFRQMQGMGLDVVLSSPYKTMLIAESRDKTDSNDAHRLAKLLRGGYIPPPFIMRGRWERIVPFRTLTGKPMCLGAYRTREAAVPGPGVFGQGGRRRLIRQMPVYTPGPLCYQGVN